MSKDTSSLFKALQYSPHKELRALESTFCTDSEEPRGPLTASLKVSQAISDILGSSLTQKAMNHSDEAFRRFADDYQTHMDFGANVFELEANYMNEKYKSEAFEAKFQDAERMYLQERKYAQELGKENIKLRKNCRQNEDSMKHYESKIVNILRNSTGVNFENNNLCKEIKRLSEAYNIKLKEIEEKYHLEVKAFKEETEKLKVQLKSKDLEHANVVKNLKRDHLEQVKSLETTIRDKERVIAEFESELKSSRNFQKVVKLQWNDELKRKLGAVKDQEQEKYEPVIKELEEKVEMLELHSHDLSKELFSIQETIILKDNIINDLKLQFNSKLIPLNTEMEHLKDELSTKYTDIERLHVELAEKDDTISRIESESISKEQTILQNMKSYDREVDRLIQKNESDLRKFQAYEDKMKHKLVELADLIETSEKENERLRINARRLRQDMAVNVDQALIQTFIGYENGNIDLL